MYHNDHAPPHIHAIYQGHEALIAIADGTLQKGNLPKKALRIVTEWMAAHRGELESNWILARQMLSLEQIPGADQDD